MKSSILICMAIIGGVYLFIGDTSSESIEETAISGTLLMLDNRTPHGSVVVQAVPLSPDGRPIPAHTTEASVSEPPIFPTERTSGSGYKFANLKPGTYQVRCYTIYTSICDYLVVAFR